MSSRPQSTSAVELPAERPAHRRQEQEREELARTLQMKPGELRWLSEAESASDDSGYEALVADPIKSRMAPDADFFHRIKADLARELLADCFGADDLQHLRVLDVGCGTGHLMRELKPHFHSVIGCDPSQRMARLAGPDAVYMPSPARLPFAAGTFDVVVCACVYHHIAPDRRLAHLREIDRVLRDDGALLIFEHNPRNPVTRYIVNRCPIDSGAVLVRPGRMKKLLHAAGFLGVRNRSYLFLPQHWYEKFSRLERWLSHTGLGGQYCTIGRKSLCRSTRTSRNRIAVLANGWRERLLEPAASPCF